MTNPTDPWSGDPNGPRPPVPSPSASGPPDAATPPPGPQYWNGPAAPWDGAPPQPPTNPWQQPPGAWQRPSAPPSGWDPSGGPAPSPYAYRRRESGPGLGTGAFVVVVAMTLVTIVLGHLIGHDVGALMLETGTTTVDATQLSTTDTALTRRLGMWTLLALIVSLVGLGGWIAAIVAVNRRSSRALAIAAIVIGVLAPVLAIAMMIAALAPVVSQLPQ